jgi:hypothetical protein
MSKKQWCEKMPLCLWSSGRNHSPHVCEINMWYSSFIVNAQALYAHMNNKRKKKFHSNDLATPVTQK